MCETLWTQNSAIQEQLMLYTFVFGFYHCYRAKGVHSSSSVCVSEGTKITSVGNLSFERGK